MKLIQSPKHSKMVRKVNFLPQVLLKEVRTYGYEDSPAMVLKANSKSPLDSLDRNSGEGAALYEFIA
jgi:hypothetical protein